MPRKLINAKLRFNSPMSPTPLLTAAVASVRFGWKSEFHPNLLPKNFSPRDAVTADPSHYRKEPENGQVRELRLNLRGDESVPVHDALDGLFGNAVY
jgi:hypothetical protein